MICHLAVATDMRNQLKSILLEETPRQIVYEKDITHTTLLRVLFDSFLFEMEKMMF